MKNTYEKPFVEISNSIAEGVYAASGRPVCGSQYISGYRMGNGSGSTYIEYYGCAGCRNSNRGGAGCALTNGEYDRVVAANNGNAAGVEGYDGQMPLWESKGYLPGDTVTDTNCWN